MSRRYRGIHLGGLALLQPTNSPSLNLASWHHPRSITWRWILGLRWVGLTAKPHFYAYGMGWRHWGLSVGLGTLVHMRISRRSTAIMLLGVELAVTTQANMWVKP